MFDYFSYFVFVEGKEEKAGKNKSPHVLLGKECPTEKIRFPPPSLLVTDSAYMQEVANKSKFANSPRKYHPTFPAKYYYYALQDPFFGECPLFLLHLPSSPARHSPPPPLPKVKGMQVGRVGDESCSGNH